MVLQSIIPGAKIGEFSWPSNYVFFEKLNPEKNPLQILEQLKNLPALKNNKDFEVLYEFIKHRQNNPDPRHTSIQQHIKRNL